MEIRYMLSSDYSEVHDMLLSLHNLHKEAKPDLFKSMDSLYTYEQYLEMIENEKYICFVSSQDKNILGICISQIVEHPLFKDVILHIDDLYVKKEARSQGIATGLFEATQKEGKRKGATRIQLNVWEFNQSAIRFYEKRNMTIQSYTYSKKL